MHPQSQNITTMQPTNQPSTTIRGSYAHAASSTPGINFPKKEQAIVLAAIEGPKLGDYVKAISDLTGPRNIIFASRISNNRICIYLSTIKVVDDLIKSHNKVMVLNNEVSIRKLITPAKRIIISNASPSIPHETIATSLRSIGLRLASQITFLRAGMSDELSHVLSFRRQVYVVPLEEHEVLPSSIVIKSDDTNQRIFLTLDDMACFLCKLPGHVAANCPNTTSGTPDTSTSINTTLTQNVSRITSPEESANQMKNSTLPEPLIQLETTSESIPTLDVFMTSLNANAANKRPISSNSTPSTPEAHKENADLLSQDAPEFISPSLPTKSKKKLKRSSSIDPILDITPHLVNVKKMMEENPTQYICSYSALKCFIENSFGNKDVLTEAKRFTADVPGLLQTLLELHPHINNKSLKNRFTRIRKRLIHMMQNEEKGLETTDTLSTTSQESLDNSADYPDHYSPTDASER